MTDEQWDLLKRIVRGERVSPLPTAFIIDSPWLPNWHGVRILDYFTSQQIWMEANLEAIETFPEVMFLPGFWSEFGMCTEPSAFGSKSTFPANQFPHAHKVIHSEEEIEALPVPDPATDGLLPLVLNRLKLARPAIEAAGHKIRFAVARGPMNISSYLMGTTEFLELLMIEPGQAHALMRKVTDFLKAWIRLQMETFPTIDGIFLLDDIIGFMGEREFRSFGLPYFRELYDFPVSIKFLHNDAPCKVCAPILPEMGVNLFNMGYDVSLPDLQELTGHQVTLLGNLPPRDVLASGSVDTVRRETTAMLSNIEDTRRIIPSCGGGMPPGVPSDNVRAFIEAVRSASV